MFDRPGEPGRDRTVALLLTVTGILTTCAIVIVRVKVSCKMSVDGIGRDIIDQSDQ